MADNGDSGDEKNDETPDERLRWLLSLEIRRIVVGLEQRRDLLAGLWSRARAREPMLQTLFSRWSSLEFQHLLTLDREAIVALEAFYGLLSEVRLYVGYTDDMPTTMLDEMDAYRGQLHELGDAALKALGVEEIRLQAREE